MTEVEFEAMLGRYLSGTSRPGERALVEQWSAQLGTPDNLTLPPAEHAEVRAAMWRQIEQRTQAAAQQAAPAPGRVLRHPAATWGKLVGRWAALLLLLVGGALVGLLLRKQAPTSPAAASSWRQHRNAGPQAQVLALADGSRVTLAAGSRLLYRPGLAGLRREVRLEGEAFFQVAKNPARPFLVYTNQLVTTVLGTSFRVKAYAGQRNEVAVQEGRVAVQIRRGAELSATPAQPAARGVVLLPNQRVSYSALAPRPLHKQLVANPVLLAPQVFTFRKEPVRKVLQALEKAYGVEIVYDPAKLAACTVTVTFYQESLYEKLDILSKVLGASYSPADNARIEFRSPGCGQ